MVGSLRSSHPPRSGRCVHADSSECARPCGACCAVRHRWAGRGLHGLGRRGRGGRDSADAASRGRCRARAGPSAGRLDRPGSPVCGGWHCWPVQQRTVGQANRATRGRRDHGRGRRRRRRRGQERGLRVPHRQRGAGPVVASRSGQAAQARPRGRVQSHGFRQSRTHPEPPGARGRRRVQQVRARVQEPRQRILWCKGEEAAGRGSQSQGRDCEGRAPPGARPVLLRPRRDRGLRRRRPENEHRLGQAGRPEERGTILRAQDGSQGLAGGCRRR